LAKRRAVVDEKDLKILEELKKNARTPYSKIAKELGVSDVAVLKRVRRLESLGVIARYTIEVDLKKLGYEVVSITGVDVEPEQLFAVAEQLKGKEYVKRLAITAGDHAMVAEVVARSGEELAEIHKEISAMPGVKRVCPAIVMEVLKSE